MKDQLDPANLHADKAEIHINQEKKDQQEYTFVGSMVMYKGTHLWSFNLKTNEFRRVELKAEVDVTIGQSKKKLTFADIVLMRPAESVFKYRADFNPDCMYCIAINAKNAAKKFNKSLPLNNQILVKKDYGPQNR